MKLAKKIERKDAKGRSSGMVHPTLKPGGPTEDRSVTVVVIGKGVPLTASRKRREVK